MRRLFASGNSAVGYASHVNALQRALIPAWLTLAIAGVSATDFDVILRHGRLVDGTGNPARFADLAVKGGRIASVGRVAGTATLEIDANGLVIAPGFIDVHTHAEDIEERPLAENFVRMGVTTLVLGNCGSSTLDVGGFLRKLEAGRISANVATLVGHGSIRSKVMGGSFMRPPTAPELAEMKAMVGLAMRDGALGLSTGLIYLPGTFAKTEEIIELARVAAEHDGIYTSHMRSESTEIFQALEEVFRIAREAGIPAEVSHLKLAGKANWGQTAKVIAALEQARASGLDITQDQYVYDASSTGINQLVPEKFREGDDFAKRLADPETKSKVMVEMKEALKKGGREDYAYAFIANYEHEPALNGLNLREAARRKRGGESLEDQIELIFDIQLHGGASGVFHGIDEGDLQQFLRHPNTMFASDSGVRAFGEGVPHPRGYGNNARVLARYVRELKLLRLEDAIRRMTSLPAATFRLKDRGMVREGAWADLVVFDPAKVQDHATYAKPHQFATGFAWVLVNGEPVVKNDGHTKERPGMALRH